MVDRRLETRGLADHVRKVVHGALAVVWLVIIPVG
jgi:hypothetical protein